MRRRTHRYLKTRISTSSTLPFPAGAYRVLLGD